MFKPATLIIVFLMTIEHVVAAPVMTHARFKQLSPEQQDQYLVKVMQLMVELEGRYKKYAGRGGAGADRYRRYVELKNLLESIFLSTAYASAPRSEARDWNGLAADFQNLMSGTRQGRQNCIFAGWVSRTIVSGGQTLCHHPDFINGSAPNRHRNGMPPEAQAYPAPAPNSGCGANNRGKIQCSPLIFGYQREADHSLFCVDASNGAHNSSYLCMQKALGEGADQDPKEDRLKALRRRLSENPAAFDAVWKFTYQTCMCEQLANRNENFSQGYADYMRPHQTCYGLMEMMAATALDCQEPELPFPTEATNAFTALRNFMRGRTISAGEGAGQAYAQFLQEHRQSNAQEHAAICGNETQPPRVQESFECSATCQRPAQAGGAITCSYSVKRVRGENRTDVPLATPPTEVPRSTEETSIRISPAEVPGGVDCRITFNGEPPPPRGRPTIRLNPTKRAADYDVRVMIMNYTDDWTFRWVTRGGTATTGGDQGARPNIEPVVAGDSADPTPTPPATGGGDPGNGTGTPPPDSKTLSGENPEEQSTHRRRPQDYEVCAVLEKSGEQPIEACTTIERVAGSPQTPAPRPASPPLNFAPPAQQPPQMPQRPPADTSAVGIR
jgi:hypothetical protein